MVARLIFISQDGKRSAVLDLITGEIINATGRLTLEEARELVRPLLEKFLHNSSSNGV